MEYYVVLQHQGNVHLQNLTVESTLADLMCWPGRYQLRLQPSELVTCTGLHNLTAGEAQPDEVNQTVTVTAFSGSWSSPRTFSKVFQLPYAPVPEAAPSLAAFVYPQQCSWMAQSRSGAAQRVIQ